MSGSALDVGHLRPAVSELYWPDEGAPANTPNVSAGVQTGGLGITFRHITLSSIPLPYSVS